MRHTFEKSDVNNKAQHQFVTYTFFLNIFLSLSLSVPRIVNNNNININIKIWTATKYSNVMAP